MSQPYTSPLAAAQRASRIPRIMGWIGMLLLLLSAALWVNGKADEDRVSVANAVVVDSIPGTGGNYRPVVQFSDPSGQANTYTMEQQSPTAYQVGSTMRVIYSPGPPMSLQPAAEYHPTREARLSLGVGLLLLLGAWYFSRRIPEKHRRQSASSGLGSA